MADTPIKLNTTNAASEPEAMSETDKLLMSIIQFNKPGTNGIELNFWDEAAVEVGVSVDTLKKDFEDTKNQYLAETDGVVPPAPVIRRRKRTKRDSLEANDEADNNGDDVSSTPPVPKRQRKDERALPEPQASVQSDNNDEQTLFSDKEDLEDLDDPEEQGRPGTGQPQVASRAGVPIENAEHKRGSQSHAGDNSSQE
ncbi:hypothetical protein PG995_003169 [Apiospora arundinis]